MTPDVSVVIPTYDRRAYLPATLASIFDTAEGVALEVIVVDDGSSDGTADWLTTHPDARVRVLREPHRGIAASRNAGIAAARAPIIAFFDSDDFARPGRWRRPLAELARTPSLDAVLANGEMLPPDERPADTARPWIQPPIASTLAAHGVDLTAVYRWNLGQIQGLTVRRSALERVGPLDTSLRILDDLDLVFRLAMDRPLAFLPEALFAYRHHAGGVARNRLVVREETIRVVDRVAATTPALLQSIGARAFRGRQAKRWARVAALRAGLGDRAGAREAAAQAVALRPWSLRHRWLARRMRSGGA